MANINPSMSKRMDMADTIMPEVSKSKEVSAKSKGGSKFEEHLEEPPIKSTLAQAQKQTSGSTRSSTPTPRPAPDRKSMPDQTQSRESKSAQATKGRSSLDMNERKAPAPKPEGEARASKDTKTPEVNAKPQTNTASKPDAPVKSPLTGTAPTKATENKPATEGAVMVLQEGDIPDDGTLEAIAYDPKELEGEPWQKRLEDMMMFMGMAPQALQQEIPSLALLTGQLQNIEPESIPTILAESPLLQNVMASADPEAVVEQIKPLGLWLDDIGWSPEGLVIKDPVAFQDLMNTPVSLKDVMKTFEVDVDRVVKEANILKETLPMDGAAPYIARATRMQAESGKPVIDKAANVQRKVKGAESDNNDSDILALLGGAAVLQGEVKTLIKGKEGAVKAPETLSKSSASTIDQLIASMAAPVSSAQGLEGLPKVALTAENPFQNMTMTASETISFDENGFDTSPTPRENRQDWLENIQAFQLQSEGVDTKTMSDSTRAFNPEVILERMGEASLAGFAESSGENEQGDEFLGEREGEAPSAPHSSGTNKSQNTFDLGTAETQKAQPTHPVQKAVFENAEMLVKDGGGAIRIDIGNNETGKIDLAVEVKDGKVEVKISADSPEARQLIAQDLPRLKEQLQNQNLNLSKVEVGLSGGSSWTSSDGRSSREESSQSAQSEELLGVNGRPGRKTSRSYSRSSNTAEVQPGVIREGGGIKVRV